MRSRCPEVREGARVRFVDCFGVAREKAGIKTISRRAESAENWEVFRVKPNHRSESQILPSSFFLTHKGLRRMGKTATT
jgi:hypothetical protein